MGNLNNKVAFVFPGQGCQRVGMGKSLAQEYKVARQVFDEVDDTLGFSLSKLCFYGPQSELNRTKNAQPAIVATSIAMFKVAKSKGIIPNIVSGHSVGEYSALVASGTILLQDAIRLVDIRGRLMEEADPLNKGGMSAVLGLTAQSVTEICKKACTAGWVEPANYNSPEQTVISGDKAGLKKAKELCLKKGAKRVIPLRVSGPFHSRLMTSAKIAFESELEKMNFNAPSIPQVMNVDGKISESPLGIRNSLAKQISGPIMWEDCVKEMWEYGASTFIQLGPGQVLVRLIHEIQPKAKAFPFDEVSLFHNVLGFNGGGL